MAQVLVDLVLTNRMLDVVVLDLLRPTVVEVVHLAGDLTTRLQVIRLVHFRVATLAQHAHDKVAILEDSKVITTVVHAAVLGSFLVSHALELLQVHHFLFFQDVKVLFEASLLVLKDLQLELVDFLLLVLIDVVVGGLLEVVLALLIGN